MFRLFRLFKKQKITDNCDNTNKINQLSDSELLYNFLYNRDTSDCNFIEEGYSDSTYEDI